MNKHFFVRTKPTHFYVFYYKNGCYTYERTCGTEDAAAERVKELNQRGLKAVFLIDHLITGYFY